ncbi:SulP family inorganic anion transporter [Gordonia hirsuta]|uniref:SulP family inorganic anion transporter n=1 Tax=Gordonia hirsuta TaxID=53427 RepID=UPI0006878436|nr:SulP family inorganic anion transporter [Gordonia hirsuta]
MRGTSSGRFATIRRQLVPPAFRGYQRAWLRADIMAGLALAAVAIPEAMGYSTIAQVPISAGLYSMIVPVIVFGLIGASRIMVVGADSGTAALLASGIAGLSIAGLAPFSDEWLGWAGLIAIVTAAMLLLARLLRLGFLGDFLSPPVLVGFLAGVGVLVITEQVPGMLGIGHGDRTDPNVVSKWIHIITSPAQIHWWSVGFAAVTLTLIFAASRLPRRLPLPVPIVMVVGSIILVMVADLDVRVATVGEFTGGMPKISLPIDDIWHKMPLVLTISFGALLVILAQSAATARSFAQKNDDAIDVDRDILGLSAANLAAGFTGSFVVNSSPTRTAIVQDERGRSQLANIVMALVVLVATVALAGPLAHLPEAVIAAIVFVVGLHLIDLRAFGRIWWVRRSEFVIAVATTFAVVWFGVLTGIITAMVISLLQIIHRQYRPERFVVGVGRDGRRVYESAGPGHQTLPGLIVFRYDADLFYANVGRFADDVMRLVKGAPVPVRWLVLDTSATSGIDYSAAHQLRHLIDYLRAIDARFALAGVTPELETSLRTARLMGYFGPDEVYPSVTDAISAYRSIAGHTGTEPIETGPEVEATGPVSVDGDPDKDADGSDPPGAIVKI